MCRCSSGPCRVSSCGLLGLGLCGLLVCCYSVSCCCGKVHGMLIVGRANHRHADRSARSCNVPFLYSRAAACWIDIDNSVLFLILIWYKSNATVSAAQCTLLVCGSLHGGLSSRTAVTASLGHDVTLLVQKNHSPLKV